MAINSGADIIGLVGKMPSGPGPISDEAIATIVKATGKSISQFVLTSEQSAAGIIAHHRRVLTDSIQIVDEIPVDDFAILREQLPGTKLIQVVHVRDQASIDYAGVVMQHADALLLDSGNPLAAVKTLGGTGNTHDWKISRQIVEQSMIPVFLAGGLHAGNVSEAIRIVQPYGVDICSGVRTDGKLDRTKLYQFIKAVNQSANQP